MYLLIAHLYQRGQDWLTGGKNEGGKGHKAFWLKKKFCKKLSFVSQFLFAAGEVQCRAFYYEAPSFRKCWKYFKKQSNCLFFKEEFS
jgi:hypothetical protein